MDKPLVSIIIPSYNHEKYISESIESVLNQSFANLELIIIDDASKDKSKEIIKVYEGRDSRIRALFHDENKGIAETLNEAIKEAKGKFIAFIASDDVWVKDKLKKQFEVLKKNEDLVVWSEGAVVNAQGMPNGITFTQMHVASEKKKSGNIFKELLKGNYICGQSVILKRENLGDIRFDEKLKYLNDYKFMVDLASRYDFYFIDEILVMYRIHGKNSILSDKVEWQKDRIIITDYFLKKFSDEMSNKIKWRLFLNISGGYSAVGENVKARRYVYQAIKLNPLHYANLPYLLISWTNEGGDIRNVLKWIYKMYKGRQK